MTRAMVVLALLVVAGCGGKAARPDVGRPELAPGRLTLVSRPSGAAVFEDQHRRLGKTPLTLTRPGGTRLSLLLVKDGHGPRPVTAVFDSGRRLTLEVSLTPKQSELVVTSAPLTGAEILVDGVSQGRTPNRLSVEAGVEHRVEVRKQRFETYQETVTLRPGEQRQISAALQRQGSHIPTAVLVLRVNAVAAVYLDGKLLGQTPLPPLPITARPHQLRVKGRSGREEHRRLAPKPGQRLEVVVEIGPARR